MSLAENFWLRTVNGELLEQLVLIVGLSFKLTKHCYILDPTPNQLLRKGQLKSIVPC